MCQLARRINCRMANPWHETSPEASWDRQGKLCQEHPQLLFWSYHPLCAQLPAQSSHTSSFVFSCRDCREVTTNCTSRSDFEVVFTKKRKNKPASLGTGRERCDSVEGQSQTQQSGQHGHHTALHGTGLVPSPCNRGRYQQTTSVFFSRLGLVLASAPSAQGLQTSANSRAYRRWGRRNG